MSMLFIERRLSPGSFDTMGHLLDQLTDTIGREFQPYDLPQLHVTIATASERSATEDIEEIHQHLGETANDALQLAVQPRLRRMGNKGNVVSLGFSASQLDRERNQIKNNYLGYGERRLPFRQHMAIGRMVVRSMSAWERAIAYQIATGTMIGVEPATITLNEDGPRRIFGRSAGIREVRPGIIPSGFLAALRSGTQ